MARRAKEREEADWPIFQGYLAGWGTEGMNWVRGGLGKKEGVVSEKTRCLVKTADVVQALNQTAVVKTVIVTSPICEAR